MVRLIDAHRATFGVEPTCAVLPIAPSVYYERKAREREPDRRPTRARRDEPLGAHIERVWQAYAAPLRKLAAAKPPSDASRIHRELLKLGVEIAELTVSGLVPKGRPHLRQVRAPCTNPV